MSVKKMKTGDLPHTDDLALWVKEAIKGDAVIYYTGLFATGKICETAYSLYQNGTITLTSERFEDIERTGSTTIKVVFKYNYIAVKL